MGPRAHATPTKAGGFSRLIVLAAPAVVVTAVLITASAGRVATFNDPIILWQEMVDLQPENSLAQHRGPARLDAGRLPEAMERLREAVRLKPDVPTPHHGLALVAMRLRLYDEAIAHFRELVRLHPEMEEMRNDLAVGLLKAGRVDEAIAEFRRHARHAAGDVGRAPTIWERARAGGPVVGGRGPLRAKRWR